MTVLGCPSRYRPMHDSMKSCARTVGHAGLHISALPDGVGLVPLDTYQWFDDRISEAAERRAARALLQGGIEEGA